MKFKAFKLFLFSITTALFAVTIQVNQVGYEKTGPKTAIFQPDSASTTAATEFKVLDQAGATVFTGKPQDMAKPWKNRSFQVLDFTAFTGNGTFTIQASGVKSAPFTIGDNLLFDKAASSVLGFFDSMRNTDNDRAIPFFYDSSKTHNVYGGWNDATGDRGKYLSHLSYANYFNPQQIPFVVWSMLKSKELNPSRFSSIKPDIATLAAWGGDYLLRVLDQQNFFYITVFDQWGAQSRQICAWEGETGKKTVNHQAAMREGAGISIAALARLSRAKIQGDSTSAQYIAAAERAYLHLKTKNLSYVDDGKENIIDNYCGLLAAVELYKTTNTASYKDDAMACAEKLVNRQHADGWFWSDDAKTRPFYHAADEGLVMVALCEFLSLETSSVDIVKSAIQKNVLWYLNNSDTKENPFNYPRLKYLSSGASSSNNIALNKPAKASQSESSPYNGPASQAFDSDLNTRWASGMPYTDTAWIQVDLGTEYSINSVSINWETACGKEYAIKVSSNGTVWTTAQTVSGGAPGIKNITFTPVKCRYVRMQGISRATSYGYSIFDFQVYGSSTQAATIAEDFFIPHANETGYWWQGENARLASVSTGLQMAISIQNLVDDDTRLKVKKIAQSELDWILGKNPFGLCFLYGFGVKNYPTYPSKTGLTNFKGGVCNGITSGESDPTELAWAPYPEGLDYWRNWRWIEQWLPHDAWFLLAIAQQSNMFDNPYIAIKSPLSSISRTAGIGIALQNNQLTITLPQKLQSRNNTLELTDLKGRTLNPSIIASTASTIRLSTAQLSTGFYFIRINKSGMWHQVGIWK